MPQLALQLTALPPIMSQTQFAALVGVTKDVVRGWLQNGTVPSVKVGKQLFVSIVALVSDIREGKDLFCKGDYDD